MITCSIIGCGIIGKHYLNSVQKSRNFSLASICDIDNKAFDGIDESLHCKLLNDYTNIKDVDVVIICTPNSTHKKISGYFISKGIHVLIEKPIACNSAEALELINYAHKNNVYCKTLYHRTFNKHFLKIKEKIKKTSDTIDYVLCTYKELITDHISDGWSCIQVGGGCVIDNGVNVFDMIYDLVGEFSITNYRLGYDTDFTDCINIETSGFIACMSHKGALISIELDWLYGYGEEKTCTIGCSSGKTYTINLLEGFNEFKSSLEHEYDGILDRVYSDLNEGGVYKIDARSIHHMKLVEMLYKQ